MLGSLIKQFSNFGNNWALQCNKIMVTKSSLIGSFYLSSTSTTTTTGLNNKSGKNVKQHDTATKHLVIRNKIEQHDFDIKVKTVLKWLAKGYDVHIVLQNVTKGEGKNELISDSLKNILQKKGILEKLNKNEKEWKLIVHPINEQSDSDVSTLLEPTVSNKLT